MNFPHYTVETLHAALGELIQKGFGHIPVCTTHIDSGRLEAITRPIEFQSLEGTTGRVVIPSDFKKV